MLCQLGEANRVHLFRMLIEVDLNWCLVGFVMNFDRLVKNCICYPLLHGDYVCHLYAHEDACMGVEVLHQCPYPYPNYPD